VGLSGAAVAPLFEPEDEEGALLLAPEELDPRVHREG